MAQDQENKGKKRVRGRTVSLNVNGEWQDISIKPNTLLLDAIRDQVGLTGTKDGCESGTCGACTVLADGRPVLSCITLAVECDEMEISTVEGLAQGEDLNPLQEAFLDQGAVQCGFCTPGVLMSATALLARTPKPTREEINKALEGNLCRCTGYNSIVDAILQVSGQGVAPRML
ncbi:MAG: (2Fe-2S)-binding protein [Rhodospirillales bacterium]|nr:(2Fe-2S)-binding protein [Rhodospirillales bacterium]